MFVRCGTWSRFAACLLTAALPCGAAMAQAAPSQSPPAAAAAPSGDPVVAKVNGVPIHLSEVKAAAEALPANLRAVPFETIYPKLLDSMISQRVLAAAARKAGLDKTPEVQQQIATATDQVLDNALLTKVVMPSVNDQALHARYEKEIAGKPGDEEVHAKHILVESEDQAKQIIAQLEKGADFGALAKQYSKDPGCSRWRRPGLLQEGRHGAHVCRCGVRAAAGAVHENSGAYAVRLACDRSGGAPAGSAAQLRAGSRISFGRRC